MNFSIWTWLRMQWYRPIAGELKMAAFNQYFSRRVWDISCFACWTGRHSIVMLPRQNAFGVDAPTTFPAVNFWTKRAAAQKSFPAFGVPNKLGIWQLGERSNWEALRERLDSLLAAEALVVDTEAKEVQLALVRKEWDESRCPFRGTGVVAALVGTNGGDDAELLKRLLSLGVDPDLAQLDGSRASHLCGDWARLECAKVLGLCRPNASAKNEANKTFVEAAGFSCDLLHHPLGAEMARNKPLVQQFWKNLLALGFPSIAALVAAKEFWATKHLCRRRLIDDTEALQKHEGKSAIEWAEEHGETDLAKEMRFYFRYALLQEELARTHKRLDDVLGKDTTTISTVANDVKVLTEYLNQLHVRTATIQDDLKAKEEEFRAAIWSLQREMKERDTASSGGSRHDHERKRSRTSADPVEERDAPSKRPRREELDENMAASPATSETPPPHDHDHNDDALEEENQEMGDS